MWGKFSYWILLTSHDRRLIDDEVCQVGKKEDRAHGKWRTCALPTSRPKNVVGRLEMHLFFFLSNSSGWTSEKHLFEDFLCFS